MMATDMDQANADATPTQTVEVDTTDHHDVKKAHIIQVTNLSPYVDLEHMQTLFGFLGETSKIQLYDFDIKPETNSKVCFVEFVNPESVSMARHLTNTTFIDRAFVITPCDRSEIPDKETARAELQSLLLSEASDYGANLKSHSSKPSEQSRERDRHRDRDRHYSSRRLSPREPRTYRSSNSKDREISSRHRSRSPRGDRVSRRSKSKDRSTRRRSRSRESKRKRSRSRDSSSRSSRHYRSRR